jgi:preprotein translocase subunit SecY
LRPTWHDHCPESEQIKVYGGYSNMKSLGSSIAQFAAIIIFMITLAISTAAFSMWLGDGTKSHGGGGGAKPLRATTASR